MCPTINLGRPKQRDRTVNKQLYQDIYQDPRWRRLRAAKIRENPLCEDCELEGRTTLTAEVHHKHPVDTHPELAFEFDNLMSLCVKHHKIRDRKF